MRTPREDPSWPIYSLEEIFRLDLAIDVEHIFHAPMLNVPQLQAMLVESLVDEISSHHWVFPVPDAQVARMIRHDYFTCRQCGNRFADAVTFAVTAPSRLLIDGWHCVRCGQLGWRCRLGEPTVEMIHPIDYQSQLKTPTTIILHMRNTSSTRITGAYGFTFAESQLQHLPMRASGSISIEAHSEEVRRVEVVVTDPRVKPDKHQAFFVAIVGGELLVSEVNLNLRRRGESAPSASN